MRARKRYIFSAAGALALAGWLLWPGPYARHFKKPLPASATLIDYAREVAGYNDVSYRFVFKVSDDQLLNQLIAEWSLQPAKDSGNHNAESFFKLDPLPVGPPGNELNADMPHFSWVDAKAERYRFVWMDPTNGRLYAAYGKF